MNSAAMGLDNGFADSEPQAAVAFTAVARFIHSIEPLE